MSCVGLESSTLPLSHCAPYLYKVYDAKCMGTMSSQYRDWLGYMKPLEWISKMCPDLAVLQKQHPKTHTKNNPHQKSNKIKSKPKTTPPPQKKKKKKKKMYIDVISNGPKFRVVLIIHNASCKFYSNALANATATSDWITY